MLNNLSLADSTSAGSSTAWRTPSSFLLGKVAVDGVISGRIRSIINPIWVWRACCWSLHQSQLRVHPGTGASPALGKQRVHVLTLRKGAALVSLAFRILVSPWKVDLGMQTRHDCNAIATLVGCTGCITGRNTANAKSDAWSTNLNKCLRRGSWGVFPTCLSTFSSTAPGFISSCVSPALRDLSSINHQRSAFLLLIPNREISRG